MAGARLLLVDDNDMNREVAQALAILTEDRLFDGILMDCQMPVMDGYTATRLIRNDPMLSGIPIIAMTASTMAGDKEKALAAGMNDHIAKPLNMAQVLATLSRWITPARPQVTATVELEANTALRFEIPGLDIRRGMAVMEGDSQLYRDMLQRFWQGQQTFLTEFQSAWHGRDWLTARRLAHTLKGSASTIEATGVAAQATALESACEQEELRIEVYLSSLMGELSPLLMALQDELASPPEKMVVADTLDGELLAEKLRELGELLAQSDAQALALCQQIQTGLAGFSSALRAGFQEVSKAIDEFEFDQALQLLRPLISEWQGPYFH